jgi:hypothetical protein
MFDLQLRGLRVQAPVPKTAFERIMAQSAVTMNADDVWPLPTRMDADDGWMQWMQSSHNDVAPPNKDATVTVPGTGETSAAAAPAPAPAAPAAVQVVQAALPAPWPTPLPQVTFSRCELLTMRQVELVNSTTAESGSSLVSVQMKAADSLANQMILATTQIEGLEHQILQLTTDVKQLQASVAELENIPELFDKVETLPDNTCFDDSEAPIGQDLGSASSCDPAVSRHGTVGLGVASSCFPAAISAPDVPPRTCRISNSSNCRRWQLARGPGPWADWNEELEDLRRTQRNLRRTQRKAAEEQGRQRKVEESADAALVVSTAEATDRIANINPWEQASSEAEESFATTACTSGGPHDWGRLRCRTCRLRRKFDLENDLNCSSMGGRPHPAEVAVSRTPDYSSH